ncbi:MAG: 50S ribosomal protein L11 methyltransferase [Bacteroidota bacterium]
MEINPAYLSIHFKVSPELQTIILASLHDLPFLGFEERATELVGYIETEEFDPKSLQDALKNLPVTVAYVLKRIPKKNWNKEWESNYDPIRVGNFCAIRTHFHPPSTDVQHELIIHPQMSFGTGHHETTRLVIRLMKDLSFHGKSVLDMGCGTGVLGILASVLGASKVLCIDVDPWCIENSLENCALNQTEGVKVRLREEMSNWTQASYDTILANINLNVLKVDIPRYARCVKEGGNLLLSGFYEGDQSKLSKILHNSGLQQEKSFSENRWTALLCRKIT